jgi:hypothetical protein
MLPPMIPIQDNSLTPLPPAPRFRALSRPQVVGRRFAGTGACGAAPGSHPAGLGRKPLDPPRAGIAQAGGQRLLNTAGHRAVGRDASR